MSNASNDRTSGGDPLPRRRDPRRRYGIVDFAALARSHQAGLLQAILNHGDGYITSSDNLPANSRVSSTISREHRSIFQEHREDYDIFEERREEPHECAAYPAEDPFYDSDISIVESVLTTFLFDDKLYGPPPHASAEQINTKLDISMQILPGLLAAAGVAMDPLSPRTTNAKIPSVSQKPVTKRDAADVADAKLAAAKKAQKEKDHAQAPPPMVYQPEGPSGEPAEKYRTGRLLGKGGFAICHEGELRGKRYGSRGHKFALKIVKAEMSQKRMQEKFRTELQIHSKMRHPNIVEFHRAFTFEASTYVVLELCPNGSVMDMVKQRKCLSLPEVRRFTVQLCGAIKYMHARDVIHRDLKMGNLFLDRDLNLKIGDFGLAAILVSESDVKGFDRRQTMCGTPNYIAPEILQKAKKGHDHKVDIWAVGIILFAMLTGVPPFQSNTQEEIYRKVKNIDYVWPEDDSCSNFIPNEAKGLVSMLLRVDAAERPDPDHIVAHRFFSMRDRNTSRYPLIPKRLGTECRQQKPLWLMPLIPNGDVMDPVSDRISLEELSLECGVGRLKDEAGNDLGALGVLGKSVEKSLYKEFVEEQQRGLTPIVPLPADTVYISNPILDSWPSAHSSRVESAAIPTSDAVGSRTGNSGNPRLDMPILPVQAGHPSQSAHSSHAAQLRKQASRPPSQTAPRASSRIMSVNSDTLRRARNPGPSTLSANTAAALLSNMPSRSAQQPSVKQDRQAQTLPRRLGTVTTALASGVPTAATTRVPRSASAQILPTEFGLTTELVSTKKEREKAAINEKVKTAANLYEEMLEAAKVRRGPLPILPRGATESSNANGILIGPDEVAESLPSTAPKVVCKALRIFSENLYTALYTPYSPPPSITREGRLPSDKNSVATGNEPNRPDSLKGRPVVIKWVDYTNKFGIGYILDNGSVGCVFKGEEGKPPTCVIVHGGEDHLKKRKLTAYTERNQIVPTSGVPIEFFENCGEEGIKRVLVHPRTYKINIGPGGIAEKLGPGANLHDYEKRKKIVLWDKFGKYMIQTLGKSETEDPTKFRSQGERIYPADMNKLKRNSARPFIKFYQRLGNVGIWGFGNGCFQFNFPDHTKIVISDDGTWLDFYHLTLAAATSLNAGQTLQADALDKRRVVSLPTAKMLHGLDADVGDIRKLIAANHLSRKLKFIRDLADIWFTNGGLGCMGEDKKRMKWEGVLEGGKLQKLVWVTVGANGGDGAYEQEVPEGYYSQAA